LKALYRRSALGLVNFNWVGMTETFCCTAVEMMATRLPVFSFARGGLPEVVGLSGGAVLSTTPDLGKAADAVIQLLGSPQQLRELGEAGSRYVRSRYDLDAVTDQWERVLAGDWRDLDRISGPWCFHRNPRYWAERLAGWTGCGGALKGALRLVRRLRPAPAE
jgi:hypothetical protein